MVPGVVVHTTEKLLPQTQKSNAPLPNDDTEGDDEDEDQPAEVKVAEEVASFDEVMVWGHDVLPDESDDPYTKGVAEWIAFAEAVCLPPARSLCDTGRC